MNPESTPSRAPDGRWLPGGRSPNPGGVRRGTAGLVERCRRLALRYAPKAINTLADLLDNPDARVRVAAAEAVLDRAGLRPYSLEAERLEIVGTVNVDAVRAALAARLAGLAASREVEVDGRALPERASAPSGNEAQAQAVPEEGASR